MSFESPVSTFSPNINDEASRRRRQRQQDTADRNDINLMKEALRNIKWKESMEIVRQMRSVTNGTGAPILWKTDKRKTIADGNALPGMILWRIFVCHTTATIFITVLVRIFNGY